MPDSNSSTDYVASLAFALCVAALVISTAFLFCFFFGGEPDLMDSIKSMIDRAF